MCGLKCGSWWMRIVFRFWCKCFKSTCCNGRKTLDCGDVNHEMQTAIEEQDLECCCENNTNVLSIVFANILYMLHVSMFRRTTTILLYGITLWWFTSVWVRECRYNGEVRFVRCDAAWPLYTNIMRLCFTINDNRIKLMGIRNCVFFSVIRN